MWDELDFVWYIPEDEDKAIQALRMRDEYCYETGMPSPRQAPASFLEVFVSITDTLTAMLYQDREDFTKSILLNMGARGTEMEMVKWRKLRSSARNCHSSSDSWKRWSGRQKLYRDV